MDHKFRANVVCVCSAVVKSLSNMPKALGSTPNNTPQTKQTKK